MKRQSFETLAVEPMRRRLSWKRQVLHLQRDAIVRRLSDEERSIVFGAGFSAWHWEQNVERHMVSWLKAFAKTKQCLDPDTRSQFVDGVKAIEKDYPTH